MKDAEIRAQKLRIRPFIRKWRDALGLNRYDIKIDFFDGPLVVDGEAALETLASTHARWQYQTARIQWRADAMAKIDDEELECAVVHEFCHVIVNEMRALTSNDQIEIAHEERVCSELARALLWTYEAGKRARE